MIRTVLIIVLVAFGHGRALAEDVTVAVASNFTDPARDIARLFDNATGHQARLSFASTGMLFSQIGNGAPFDVFLAADNERPMKAETDDLAVPGTRFTYARGRLVLWSVTPAAFEDGEAFLKAMAFGRAAIANPRTAPYGLAARQVMEHLGVWETAERALVRGDNISQTFQFVATANVDVGFVAYSQVKAWKGERGTVWEIPEDYYTAINQQAVLLKRGRDNPAARAFLDFLKSAGAQRVIAAYGYGVE